MLLPWALGQFEQWWSFGLIVFSVVVATGLVRIAIEQGERYEQVSDRLAVVAERERVARDVHDVLGHSLTVVTLKAELAERLVDLDPERARAELAEIQVLTRRALAEIRERCLSEGMQDYITKPVDPEKLYATLARWIVSASRAGLMVKMCVWARRVSGVCRPILVGFRCRLRS